MKGAGQHALEELIRSACAEARYDDAATILLEHYGPAVLGFLIGWMGDREAAREAFSIFCEDLWSGLPRFEWRCTARGWAYTLARNAGRRHAKVERRNQGRLTPLSGRSSALVERIASSTEPYLKTDFKDRFEALRERLPPDDRLLLLLRSGRQLAFRDIVFVLGEPSSEPDEETLVREAARLRKRFQSVKERLRDLARSEGLLE